MTLASASHTSPAMQRFQRYSQTFWVIAILLLVGGQLAHAYSDYRETVCQTSHSDSEHHHSDSGASQSSESNHCCHTHPPANSVSLDSHGFVSPHLVCGTLPVTNDSVPEPPVQEIDYPPQLS